MIPLMRSRSTAVVTLALLVGAAGGILLRHPISVRAWGQHGHEISARAAVAALPDNMPAFFLEAAEQLTYLNFEPDRWRERRAPSLDGVLSAAYGSEHYIDLELVPDGALEVEGRFEFMEAVRGVRPFPGLLPFRSLELFGRLRVGFRQWRETRDDKERNWIEQRIINDAGILGHYLTDAANPHHTTIHHDRWVGDNPDGYSASGGFHGRFETAYVRAQLTLDDLMPGMNRPARLWADPQRAILDHIRGSHALVDELYRIDRDSPFNERNNNAPNREFALERLASGALMLRDAWWTAWVTSE